MKTDNTNFIMVNNDLLANQLLSSTQKLFLSYILGWQRSERTCTMTNRNLASHFGMKPAGIRSMLNKLNKHDFFVTTQYGHTENNSKWTSGHEMLVDEVQLSQFLQATKTKNINKSIICKDIIVADSENNDDSKSFKQHNRLNVIKECIKSLRPIELIMIRKGIMTIEEGDASNKLLKLLDQKMHFDDESIEEMEKNAIAILESLQALENSLDLQFENSEQEKADEIVTGNLAELEHVTQYNDADMINVNDIMQYLSFTNDEIKLVISYFKTDTVTFYKFSYYIVGLSFAQKNEDYKGVLISQDQLNLIGKMSIY